MRAWKPPAGSNFHAHITASWTRTSFVHRRDPSLRCRGWQSSDIRLAAGTKTRVCQIVYQQSNGKSDWDYPKTHEDFHQKIERNAWGSIPPLPTAACKWQMTHSDDTLANHGTLQSLQKSWKELAPTSPLVHNFFPIHTNKISNCPAYPTRPVNKYPQNFTSNPKVRLLKNGLTSFSCCVHSLQ